MIECEYIITIITIIIITSKLFLLLFIISIRARLLYR